VGSFGDAPATQEADMAVTETNSPKPGNGAAQLYSDMLSPKHALAAWRSMITLPAASMIEALHFGSRRLEAQAELLSSVLACQDAGQVFEKQSSFMRRALDDYGRETEAVVHKVRESAADQAKAA
jgi:hypothetical protein